MPTPVSIRETGSVQTGRWAYKVFHQETSSRVYPLKGVQTHTHTQNKLNDAVILVCVIILGHKKENNEQYAAMKQ